MSLHYWFLPYSDLCTCHSLFCCNFCLWAPTQKDFVPSGAQLDPRAAESAAGREKNAA